MSLFASVALLALSAAPKSEAVIVIERPAEALPRLGRVLDWVSAAAPPLRRSEITRQLEPLGLDPFSANHEAWSRIGLAPARPIELTLGEHGPLWVSARISDAPRLRRHLEQRPLVRVADVDPGWGFLVGKLNRPRLIGAVERGRVWLRRHRSLFALGREERASFTRNAVGDLSEQARTAKRHRKPRWMRSQRAARPPDAWASGEGPEPWVRWSARLWAEPTRTSGEAHVQISGPTADRARAWLPRRQTRRLLAEHPEIVAEMVTRVGPETLSRALPGKAERLTDVTTGGIHAALTAAGAIVVALELRPRSNRAGVEKLAARYVAATDGLRFALFARPGRLLLWYPGATGAPKHQWLSKNPQGRPPSPAWARVTPARLLAALQARERPPAAGPRIGAARMLLAKMTYGRFLDQASAFTLKSTPSDSGYSVRFRVDHVSDN